eukprot:Gregarina_sp_Poly_1__791@NODE_118_length_13642_cov_140_527956_g105_i0_p10_GENE_NODE_118_length_13642_cov_140_527956_g105_i0NODE_118_length_13642_cov_140_527956_g105_i0_p10_ORF_typecomplete_len144_score26_75_NODE_118_length_13642_cov_140_527956_g105_i031853616
MKEHLPPQVIVATSAPKGDLAALLEISGRVVEQLNASGIECRTGIYLRMLGMFTLLFNDSESGLKALGCLVEIEGVVDFDVDTITYIDYPQADPFDIEEFDEQFDFSSSDNDEIPGPADKLPILYEYSTDKVETQVLVSTTPL